MSKKTTAVQTAPSEEVLNQINNTYPVEQSALRIILPRLNMASQDQTEGKGKSMKVIVEAGTFFEEYSTEELDENGKKKWVKDEIGSAFEGIIIFKRKQLRHYDEATESYTSSPIYDTDDEIVPLFKDKKEIARDIPQELKKQYAYTDQDGKERSKLEENRIVYIIYKDELYQMNLRGSSMYSLMTFERSGVSIPSILTRFSSEPMEKGKIAWNKMTFTAVRALTADEAENVVTLQNKLRTAIAAEKASYGQKSVNKKLEKEKDDAEMDEIVNGATKQLN